VPVARILIAGCGGIGTALGLRLAQGGHAVWGLRRRAGPLPDPLKAVRADLTHLEELRALPPDLEFVFYTAAAEAPTEEAYVDAYVLGLRNLLQALDDARQSPRRILYTSSTGVFGQQGGEWVDEETPPEPDTPRAGHLLAGEGHLAAGPIPSVVLRMGGIYGPGRTRLLDRVRRGIEAPHMGGPIYTNRVRVEDCVGILVHLMEHPGPEGLYLGVDHEPAERNELLAYLAEGLGVDLPAPLHPSEAPAGRGRGNKRCRNGRLLDSGYSFQYPTYREGYTDLIWEARARG
jgi:nucleoside-diphosphate-sugar epimerase